VQEFRKHVSILRAFDGNLGGLQYLRPTCRLESRCDKSIS